MTNFYILSAGGKIFFDIEVTDKTVYIDSYIPAFLRYLDERKRLISSELVTENYRTTVETKIQWKELNRLDQLLVELRLRYERKKNLDKLEETIKSFADYFNLDYEKETIDE